MRLYIRDGSSHYVDYGDWFEPNITPLARCNALYTELSAERDKVQEARDKLQVVRKELAATEHTLGWTRGEVAAHRAAREAAEREILRLTIKLRRRWWHGLVTAITGREP